MQHTITAENHYIGIICALCAKFINYTMYNLYNSPEVLLLPHRIVECLSQASQSVHCRTIPTALTSQNLTHSSKISTKQKWETLAVYISAARPPIKKELS